MFPGPFLFASMKWVIDMDDDTNVLLNAVGTGGARNSRWAIASFACGLVTLLGLLGGGFVPGVVYGFLFFAPLDEN